MTDTGVLLLIERVMPERVDTCPEHEEGRLVDLNMLVITGGCERTQADYAMLLSRAGLTLTRVVPTNCQFSIIEARPAGGREPIAAQAAAHQEARHG
jgi:orsellinic acid C2-O-methyltransferase